MVINGNWTCVFKRRKRSLSHLCYLLGRVGFEVTNLILLFKITEGGLNSYDEKFVLF